MPLWKRAIDILGALTALIVLSPVLAAAALAVRLTSPGPVVFAQWRDSKGSKPFKMYKFRTMVVDAERQQEELTALNEQRGPVFKIRNDPRITPVGRVLRKTSIDELPQLWNVLKGEMSLVGPRPPLPKEVCQYQEWHRRRLERHSRADLHLAGRGALANSFHGLDPHGPAVHSVAFVLAKRRPAAAHPAGGAVSAGRELKEDEP